jgi:hypothetical protein
MTELRKWIDDYDLSPKYFWIAFGSGFVLATIVLSIAG